jgi:hypothetical protein
MKPGEMLEIPLMGSSLSLEESLPALYLPDIHRHRSEKND